jgi:hypothetical protein
MAYLTLSVSSSFSPSKRAISVDRVRLEAELQIDAFRLVSVRIAIGCLLS